MEAQTFCQINWVPRVFGVYFFKKKLYKLNNCSHSSVSESSEGKASVQRLVTSTLLLLCLFFLLNAAKFVF